MLTKLTVVIISQHTEVKSICCALETYTVRYVSYLSVVLKEKIFVKDKAT